MIMRLIPCYPPSVALLPPSADCHAPTLPAVPEPAVPLDPLAAIMTLVLHAVQSPHTRRSYALALSRFCAWYAGVGRPGLSKATLQRYRKRT